MRTKKRVRDYGEVFTPEWLVSDMVDLVNDEVSRIGSKVLEPSCGNGNFLAEILKRKMKSCKSDTDKLKALNDLYGIELLPDNVRECRERLLNIAFPQQCESRAKAVEILNTHIRCGNALEIMKEWEEE